MASQPTTPATTDTHDGAPNIVNFSALPCCPDLDIQPTCDVIDMRRRLVFPTNVRGPNEQPVRVEVIFHTRFERCSGPLSLGDLAYSTTLLPGETVRLATTDRRSRFSFDSETNLSYRSEQMSEEQYRLTALRTMMTDENVVDRGEDRASSEGKWDFHGDASGGIGFFSASADANARGSHNESSARDYLREHKAHAEASDHQSVEATRKAHSVSVGEVSTRVHTEGQSEDHFEASSRTFSNANRSHAVTYLFYRINKTETIKFTLQAIERRVIDPVAPLPVAANPVAAFGGLSAIQQEVPASAKTRIEIETRGLQSVALRRSAVAGQVNGVAGRVALNTAAGATLASTLGTQAPLAPDLRAKALADVDQRLVAAGLLDKASLTPSKEIKLEIEYSRRTALPTAGIIVKGCLDKCSTAEDDLQRKIGLELDNLDLQNQLLKRQIELLDKSRAYQPWVAGGHHDHDHDHDHDTAPAPAPVNA